MIKSIGATKAGIRIILLLFITLAISAFSQAAPIKVIANPSVKVDELNASQLRAIFSMKQASWPDGQPIKVFVLPNQHQSHQQFCKRVLRMFPYQVERIWNKLTYSGLGDLPVLVNSEEEMLAMVLTNPGAIGYVVESASDEGIHTIRLKTE